MGSEISHGSSGERGVDRQSGCVYDERPWGLSRETVVIKTMMRHLLMEISNEQGRVRQIPYWRCRAEETSSEAV